MAEQINNAEDKLFKETFSRLEYARELLQRCAPTDLVSSLQLDSLELTNASFVDSELAEHFADLVFNCKTKGEQAAQVSFIIEHKSYLPPYPPLQILNYQINGWRQQLKSKLKPAPILPVIFFHGKEPWADLPWKDYLSGMEAAFEPYTPDGRYMLIDLSALSDDAIRQFRHGFLKTVLLLMKHRYERDYLLNNLTNILIFVEEELEVTVRVEDFHIIFRYLTASISINWKEVKERSLSLFKINKAMTIIEEIKLESKQEGIQEGIQEGKQKGIQEGYELKTREMVKLFFEIFPRHSDKEIAELSKVDIEYVQQIRLETQKTEKN
ncbi:MAG: Rpn family recombination-promoting nuclease/putative transposase [Saprospiraceae bacterium]|jgi:predicted transposase/invertase (TIGR01784 family)|nr:Rpn family recombination-promoting nuclease/putative transposase [Saprospiraceae bacterium]